MKNKALQIYSLLGLLVLLTVTSVEAQTSENYTAKIPFDFSIGGKIFQAGDYVVSVKNTDMSSISKDLLIKDAKGRRLRQMFRLENGRRSNDAMTKLIFYRGENHYVLTEMMSPGFGLTFAKPKGKSHLAKQPNYRPEFVKKTFSTR